MNERDGGRCGVVVVTMWFVIMFSPCAVCVCCVERGRVSVFSCEIFFFRKKKRLYYLLFFFSLPNVHHGRSLHVFITLSLWTAKLGVVAVSLVFLIFLQQLTYVLHRVCC